MYVGWWGWESSINGCRGGGGGGGGYFYVTMLYMVDFN